MSLTFRIWHFGAPGKCVRSHSEPYSEIIMHYIFFSADLVYKNCSSDVGLAKNLSNKNISIHELIKNYLQWFFF